MAFFLSKRVDVSKKNNRKKFQRPRLHNNESRLTKESHHVVFRNHGSPALLESLVGHGCLVGGQLPLHIIADICWQVLVPLEQPLDGPGPLLGVLEGALLGLVLLATELPLLR